LTLFSHKSKSNWLTGRCCSM